MHPEQQEFCLAVKAQMPQYFRDVRVVDFGALDINGNNRYLFDDSEYVGVDIGPGKNVDVVCRAHEYQPEEPIDVVVSTEMLEHDEFWRDSLLNAYTILRPKGLMLFTCASNPRAEHGTKQTSPEDAPYVAEYYRNLEPEDIQDVFTLEEDFARYMLMVRRNPGDLYFCGTLR